MITTIFSPKQVLAVKILGALTIVVLTIVAITSVGPQAPILSSTTPMPNTQNYSIFNSLVYSFKDPVLVAQLQFTLSPEIPFELVQTKDNIITLTPKRPLQPSTRYTATTTWNNKVIYILNFTTQASQTDAALIESMKTELERDYPLGQKLPLITSQYRVVYSAPLTLEIALTNPNLTSAEAINEIKSWVTKNGGDASAHKYVIAAPSPAPTN